MKRTRADLEEFSGEIPEDALFLILGRLPAKSFASAACVSKTWNRVSNHILAKPKLLSAISLLPDVPDAVNEAADKILSQTIRPQFVIACYTLEYSGCCVHDYLQAKFGIETTIVSNFVHGVIGVNPQNDAFVEVTAENIEESTHQEENIGFNLDEPILGLTLIVGWIPDMDVGVIPLELPEYDPAGKQNNKMALSNFFYGIRNFSNTVSGRSSPSAILLFGDSRIEKEQCVVSLLDRELASESVLGGHFSTSTFFSSLDEEVCETEMVALLFARKRVIPDGVGETRFHCPLMNSVSQVGPLCTIATTQKASKSKSYLCAKNQYGQPIDRPQFLAELPIPGGGSLFKNWYVGIERPNRGPNATTSLSLYQIKMDCTSFVLVEGGTDINPGETFHFYYGNVSTGLTSENVALDHFGRPNRRVVGGIVFVVQSPLVASLNLSNSNEYSKPLLEAVPGISLGGIFGTKIVRRKPIKLAWKNQESLVPRWCHNHRKGIEFIVISHSPMP